MLWQPLKQKLCGLKACAQTTIKYSCLLRLGGTLDLANQLLVDGRRVEVVQLAASDELELRKTFPSEDGEYKNVIVINLV